MSLLINDKPTTVALTGQLALDRDESQYRRGYGPCLHAAGTGELTEVADAQAETLWPVYIRRAVEYGALSSLSVPRPSASASPARGTSTPARPTPSTGTAERWPTRFGTYASVAAANMHAYQGARDTAETLQLALESRAVIDQAKGILMERYKLTADQAFQVQAGTSMSTNRKVRDVAEHLAHTGELPLR